MRCFPVLLAIFAALPVIHAQPSVASTADFFEAKIRPVLANNCYSCHASSSQSQGGLRVDSQEAMLRGGGRGAAVVPGDPDKSWLIRAVRQTDPALKMPLGGKLSDAEVEDLVSWVKSGAVLPGGAASVTPAVKETKAGDKYVISAERKNFWSL